MAYEERVQSDGAIYINNWKKQGSKQPEWTGKVTVTKELLKELVTKIKEEQADSVDLRVALWDRVAKDKPDGTAGKEYKYARLDIPKKQNPAPEPAPAPVPEPEPVVDDFNDDDIPF